MQERHIVPLTKSGQTDLASLLLADILLLRKIFFSFNSSLMTKEVLAIWLLNRIY